MNIYEKMLWSGVSLFNASPEQNIERHQWATFVNTLNIDKNWPGIQGIGYSIPISPADKINHEMKKFKLKVPVIITLAQKVSVMHIRLSFIWSLLTGATFEPLVMICGQTRYDAML